MRRLYLLVTFAVISFIANAQNESFYPKLMVEKTPDKIMIYKHLQGNQYVGYPINHRIKEYKENEYPSNYDNWGIGRLSLCTYEQSKMVAVTTLFRSGEAELALNIPNSQDESKYVYVGGATHGFEMITSEDNHRNISIMIDGNEYKEEDNISLSKCNTIKIEQNCLLYQAYSNSNPFANVTKEWTITDADNLHIKTKVELLRDIKIKQGQFGMICVYRHLKGDTSKKYLTNKAYKDNEATVYNLEDGWDDLNLHPENSGIRKKDYNCTQITEEGEYGLSFALKVIDATKKSGGGMFVGTNSSSYNKIYFDMTGNYSAKENEILSAEVEWIVDGVFSDEETGIKYIHMNSINSNDDRYYNLNGQRVNTIQRGIYIKNGKKFVNIGK